MLALRNISYIQTDSPVMKQDIHWLNKHVFTWTYSAFINFADISFSDQVRGREVLDRQFHFKEAEQINLYLSAHFNGFVHTFVL
jgi:hypothetical protein